MARENKGFDVCGWQYALMRVCTPEALKQFDSLVLFNDSFFGPFYPFEEIFQKMEGRGVDFWGMSVHGEADGNGSCPYGYRPAYIQTYFMVFEQRLLHSRDFYSFWEKQPIYNTFADVSEKFCAVMTRQFSDLGYTWDVLSDTRFLDSEDRKYNYDHHTHDIFQMISELHYPVLKRRSFRVEKGKTLDYTGGEDLFRALEYIETHSDYDVKMIFEHLMRKYDCYEIKKALCLDYCVPDHAAGETLSRGVAAVLAYLDYEDLFEESLTYLANIPPEIDLMIVTNSEEKRDHLMNLARTRLQYGFEVRCAEGRGGDAAALLVTCADVLEQYTYLAFVHDTKSSQTEYSCVGKAYSRHLWENLFHSAAYIKNVISLFKRHPYLGLLAPFGVHHGSYFNPSLNYWAACRDAVMALADRLSIRIVEPDHPLFLVGANFWCRTDAMKPLFGHRFSYEDFPEEPVSGSGTVNDAIERIFPFAAAQQGYASGYVYNMEYARTELSNLRYMEEEACRAIASFPGVKRKTFRVMMASFDNAVREKARTNPQNTGKAIREKAQTNAKDASDEMEKTLLKRIRGVMKKFIPKPILRAYQRKKYGREFV